jgi:hypothetical protein
LDVQVQLHLGFCLETHNYPRHLHSILGFRNASVRVTNLYILTGGGVQREGKYIHVGHDLVFLGRSREEFMDASQSTHRFIFTINHFFTITLHSLFGL